MPIYKGRNNLPEQVGHIYKKIVGQLNNFPNRKFIIWQSNSAVASRKCDFLGLNSLTPFRNKKILCCQFIKGVSLVGPIVSSVSSNVYNKVKNSCRNSSKLKSGLLWNRNPKAWGLLTLFRNESKNQDHPATSFGSLVVVVNCRRSTVS